MTLFEANAYLQLTDEEIGEDVYKRQPPYCVVSNIIILSQELLFCNNGKSYWQRNINVLLCYWKRNRKGVHKDTKGKTKSKKFYIF